MDWTHVLGIVLGNAAFVVPMFLWNRGEARSDYRHLETLIRAIQEEMKDFHGRLERQDAEFKGRLEKQDAEFKAHLIYEHAKDKK